MLHCGGTIMQVGSVYGYFDPRHWFSIIVVYSFSIIIIPLDFLSWLCKVLDNSFCYDKSASHTIAK